MVVPPFLRDELASQIATFGTADGLVFALLKAVRYEKTFGRRPFAGALMGQASRRFDLTISGHTAASLMIAVGAHPKVIQERLGDTRINMTFDHYGHLFPDLDEEVASSLDPQARTAAASAPSGRMLSKPRY
jgi:integrase